MIRTILLASVFAFASPALAQQTETPPADPVATEALAEPAQDSTMAEPAAPADQAAPAEAAPATADAAKPASTQVAQVVEADFPSYDADKNGELSQTEFADWMLKLKASAPAQGSAPTAEADLKAWTGQAFAQADADKSQTVSKGELTTFLSG